MGQRKTPCAVTERRVCPRSVLYCGGGIRKSLKLDEICDGGCDAEVPPQKPLFDSSEEPNIFSLIATKLACKNDAGMGGGGGGGMGITRLHAGGIS